MSSSKTPQERGNDSTPSQSIPLRDLSRPPDPTGDATLSRRYTSRGRGLLDVVGRRPSTGYGTSRYERIGNASPSHTGTTPGQTNTVPPHSSSQPHEEEELQSPLENPAEFQAAMGFAGLSMPMEAPPPAVFARPLTYGSPPHDYEDITLNPYGVSSEDSQPYVSSHDADTTPLTDPTYLQPFSGSQATSSAAQVEEARSSFQSVRFNTPDPKTQGARLGDDLPGLDTGVGRHNYDGPRGSIPMGGSGQRISRALSVNSPLGRAGSIMRAMSQRVVNLSNEAEAVEATMRREGSSRRQSRYDEPRPHFGTVFGSEPSAAEKAHAMNFGPAVRHRMPNPLKGKSLGIFGPGNPVRKCLCDLLVYPATEPAILLLIIVQTIMLAAEASSSVYNNPRPMSWGSSKNDYFLFGLFLIYTIEAVVRIIVSGFIFNPVEYSTIDRKRGLKGAVLDKYGAIFAPQRKPSIKNVQNQPNVPQAFAPAVARSVQAMQNRSNMPSTLEDMQRLQLSRRAFLRHSFNRLDFVAIVSFWISFALQVRGIEAQRHLYIFRMMSCLRILRLLALTSGTSIILRSLKKATPSLLNVSFLIGFFWLIFAIVGVQSFKSSLKRTCVWHDPAGVQDPYTNELTFCGGHLNNVTGAPEPWIYANGTNGTTSHKGYLCPQNSLCTESEAPYNGTVSFDNIAQSMEMVFVMMTANTFSDIMYYTTNSDYLAAAIFFAFGIVIMTLWLMNLLIAVITSSFQVIREENKASAFTRNGNTATAEPSKRRLSTVQKAYKKTFWFWIMLIITGLLAQTAKSANMSQRRSNAIDSVEVIVSLLLAFEIIIRFIVDWRTFHKNKYNWVDLFLCVMTCVILLPPIRNSGQPYNWLTIFQIMRIYRVILGIPMIRGLILKVLGNATGIGNLMLFVFLMNFLVAIFAVQLFRGEIPPDRDGEMIRGTFATIWNAFIAMYQILSSENWTNVLYEVTADDNYVNTGWIAAVFFIGWFILGNFILLNMFIAVIQENFDVSEDEKRLEQVKAFLQRKELGGASASSNLSLSTLFTLGKRKKKKDPLDYGPATMEMLLKDAVVKDFLDEELDPLNVQANSQADPNTADVEPGVLSSMWGKFVGRFGNREPNPFYSNIRLAEEQHNMDARAMAKVVVSATAQRKRAQREYIARHPRYNDALFIFTPSNPIRKFCQRMVGPGRGSERFDGVEPSKAVWYTFSAFIYISIVAMVLLACVTTPLYQKEYFAAHGDSVHTWYLWVDMGFAAVFTIEATIKIIADGLFWTPNAFLRSSWGLIDALVLITLWINIATSLTNNGAIARAVGAFKALRALRLLNVSDSAKDTFHSVIIVGGSKVLSAAFVSLSLLVPFAIYGVNLFNGKLQSCNDGSPNIVNLSDCTGEYNSSPSNWPVWAPRHVSNPYYDFDSFGGSLFILFQIVSQEGWVDVMWSAIAITGNGLQPQNNTAQGNAVFFIVFNLLATVFVLTLFLSVFMRNYTEQTGVAFLTADQRSWVELRKLLYRVSPSKRPHDARKDKFKNWCYKQATKKHGPWHRSMTFILVCHLGLLMIEYYPEPVSWSRARDYVFLLFTFAYIANIVVRIVGLSWPRFSKSSWDIFSLAAVSGTLGTTILLLTNTKSDTYVQLHKLFLVSIVLLLIPRNDALDQLFKTAAASLPNIGNLLATWIVLFLVFAIALTQAFGLTRFTANENNNVNFRTVPKALILLFRMSMGEGWNQIMEDFATVVPPLCVLGDSFYDSDCGSAAWARTLFIAWNILSMYIFVSLFVSLIYESFSYVYQRSSGLSSLSREELRRFKEAWALFDPQGTGFIQKAQFPRLLAELSGSFRMRIYDDEDSVRRILDDVRANTAAGRSNSVGTTHSLTGDIDLEVLNERLSQINVQKVQERRHRFNLFYEEVLVSADPDRGISFTSVLMILAHYNVINDSKSLRLEEFLRRRARLQRVEEEARRRIVVGFFDTMYWARRFHRHLTRHDSARMTNIPQFAVPEIFVNDGEPSKKEAKVTVQPYLSPNDITEHRTSWNDGASMSPNEGTSATNLNHRRQGTGGSVGSLRSPGSPKSPSAFASPHDLWPHHPAYPPAQGGPEEAGSTSSSRRGSAVSAENVMEVLDNSVWGESIRRSFTTRRPRDRTGSS